MSDSRVTFTLNHVVAVLNAHGDSILRARFEMTFSQFIFLVSLRGEQLTITELARRLDVSAAAVSKRVPWFLDRGLVKVQGDASNARKVLVSLTAKGERFVDRAARELDEAFTEKFSDMHDVNLPALNRTLSRVLEHLTAMPKEESR